ncbi:MAG: peroxiredoxin-like family protein [Mycobacterium sp.]|nr:peroxiredoxin-like family protein [Mycobacterium sp.]
MTTLEVGETIALRQLSAIDGAMVSVPDSNRVTHLQFRRFAGCPICHLHLRSITQRHDEIRAAGISEVVVFHSTAEALRKYQVDLPFAVIADPYRDLYTEFGVESSPTAIAHPRAWLAAARGAIRQRSLSAGVGRGEDHLGKPADFLIASDGRLLAAKYGSHADDQWSVDEILSLGAQLSPP